MTGEQIQDSNSAMSSSFCFDMAHLIHNTGLTVAAFDFVIKRSDFETFLDSFA